MFKYSLLLGLYSLVHLTKIIIISIDFFNCCRGGVVILINADSTDKHNHYYFLLVLHGCYNSTINHSVVGHLFHFPNSIHIQCTKGPTTIARM